MLREFDVTPEHRAALYRSLLAWTRDPVIADDLTQETLIEAFRSRRRPDDPGEWQAWTFGIARNILLRHLRSKGQHAARHVGQPESNAQLAALGRPDDADAGLTEREVRRFLDEALAHLPIPTRQAMLLRYSEGLNQQEAAVRLGITESALEGRLHRGKRRLRQHLVQDRPADATSLGLVSNSRDWIQTNIWCRACGRRTLVARWTADGDVWADCEACDAPPTNGARSCVVRTFDAYQGIESALRSAGQMSFAASMEAIPNSILDLTADGYDTVRPCPRCHGSILVFPHNPSELLTDLRMQCTTCSCIAGWAWSVSSCTTHPLVTSWFRAQERTRLVTSDFLTTVGSRLAVHLRFESVTNSSTIEAWRGLETMKFLQVERDGVLFPLDQAT